MSAPRLTLWDEFLTKLEQKANLHPGLGKVTPDARAQRACTIIQNRDGRESFLGSIRDALETTGQGVPPNTTSLAQIRWPLVVSTNYDDLFFYACRCRRPLEGEAFPNEMNVQVLGRSAKDCKLIVSSLTGPFDRQYIWHIQGFLGGQYPGRNPKDDIPDIKSLEDQLVIGHAEYRRVANRAPEFRRCFAEVFNSRSFLFLGSSLREDYFLNLFGEVLDLCGPSAVPHFAFMEKEQVDASFLASQMNIAVSEFPPRKWEELPHWLDCLKEEIEKPKARSSGWSFGAGPSSQVEPVLEIARGPAPFVPRDCGAIAFVAHRNNDDLPVPPGRFADLGAEHPSKVSKHIFYYPGRHLYAVTARCGEDDDDSAVYFAARELLDKVTELNQGITILHVQLSATGGTVPPVYGFMEMVRTFAEWRLEREREHKPALRLVLYIESDVELTLTSGRIDIRELLASELLRFWAVVISVENQEPVRRSLHYRADTELKDVLKDLSVPPESSEWFVSVCPSPRKKPPKQATRDVHDQTLTKVGIGFGSVLILEYKPKGRNTREGAVSA